MRVKRLILFILGMLTACTLVSTIGLATYGYHRLTEVVPDCRGMPGENWTFSPASFGQPGMETTPYLMPNYEEVHFPSRDTDIEISGFYIPSDVVNTSTVIVVHGVQACKNMPTSLLPAGMLHRNGFNVLAIDLRNMGASEVDNGRMAGGSKEYQDVLGAWDWLTQVKQIAPSQIGLFGYSLGGASALIAMGLETRVASAWVDSSYSDVKMIADDLMKPYNLNRLVPIAFLMGQLLSGDNILSIQPINAVSAMDGRPVYVVHGTADKTVPVNHAHLLSTQLEAEDSLRGLWITEGSQHVSSMFDYPAEYEERLISFYTETITPKD